MRWLQRERAAEWCDHRPEGNGNKARCGDRKTGRQRAGSNANRCCGADGTKLLSAREKGPSATYRVLQG